MSSSTTSSSGSNFVSTSSLTSSSNQGSKKYTDKQKRFLSGSPGLRVSDWDVKCLNKEIWGEETHFVEENTLEPLKAFWSEEKDGLKYLECSLRSVLCKERSFQWGCYKYTISKPFYQWVNVISLASQIQSQAIRDCLLKTMAENSHTLSQGLREAISEVAKNPLGSTQRLKRLQDTFSFLKTYNNELYYQSLKVVEHLKGSAPKALLKLKIQDKTLKQEVASLYGSQLAVDEAGQLRRELARELGLDLKLDTIIDEKLIGIVLGDYMVSGSALEGYNFAKIVSLFLAFYKQLSIDLTSDLWQMKHWLEDGKATQDETLKEMADTLRRNRRVVVPAGWQNPKGGHAMVIEAMLNGNSKATVRIYNQGAGVSRHRKVETAFRERYDAYLEKRDIPEEIVLSPAFWGTINQMRRTVGSEVEPYHSGDIYEWFIHCIPGTICDAHRLILAQRSGSCTVKSLLSLFKARLSEADYDNLVLRFKFGILLWYEEGLCYRRGAIGLAQKRFLREVRQKLLGTVQLQRAAGRINDRQLTLLTKYCKVDIQLDEDKGFKLSPQQLKSTFDTYFSDAGYDPRFLNESGVRLCHNNSYRPFALKWHQSTPYEDFSNLPQHLRVMSGVEDCEQQIFFIHRLPTIAATASASEAQVLLQPVNEGVNLDQGAFECYHVLNDWLSKCDELFLWANRGPREQLAHAWATEWVLTIIEEHIRRSTNQSQLLYTLSLPAGEHPLERKDSWLNGQAQVLDPESERLLEDWLQRRQRTRSKLSVVSVQTGVRQHNGNVSVGLSGNFEQTSPFAKWVQSTAASFFLSSEFKNYRQWYGEAAELRFLLADRSKQAGQSAASQVVGLLGTIFHAYARDTSQQKISRTGIASQRLDNHRNSVVFNGSSSEENPVYAKIQAQTELAARCLPYIGMDLQLSEMEQNHETLVLYQPELTWFQLALATDSERRDNGLLPQEACQAGLTPFDIAVKDESFGQQLAPRILKLAEAVLGGDLKQRKLCVSVLALLSQINLRLKGSQRLCLRLSQQIVAVLNQDVETALALACYQLTLTPPQVSEKQQLIAAYYLLTRNGLEQREELTQRIQPFFKQVNYEELARKLGKTQADEALAAARKIAGAQHGGFVVDPKEQVPVLAKVSQFWDRDWKEQGEGRALYESLEGLSFGEWKLVELPVPANIRREVVREWRSPQQNCHVLQLSREETKHQRRYQVNGPALKKRLDYLKVALHGKYEDLLKPGAYFMNQSPLRLKDIPDALRASHMELWWGTKRNVQEKGFLIDTKERRVYLVEQTRAKRDCRVTIKDCHRDAELLAGNLAFQEKLYFKWCNKLLRVPHLGDTGSRIPVEIWAKGRGGANMQIWLNCLGGTLRFKITADSNGKKTYWSEDYNGFTWDSESWVAELGKLNGILLTKGREQLLILPHQKPRRSKTDSYRHQWATSHTRNPFVLRRTLHDDLDVSDSDQRLFSTYRSEIYPTILRELMLQRDWERAKHYVGLLTPSLANKPEFQQELKTKPLFAMSLDHPKARVLRLRILTTCLLEISDKALEMLGYSPALLKKDYLSYVDQYSLLEDGWALEERDELKIVTWFRRLNQGTSLMDRHLQRVSGNERVNHLSIDRGGMQQVGFVLDKSTNGVEGPEWLALFRPGDIEDKYREGLGRLMLPKADVCWRLLSSALLWNACRHHPERRVAIARHIQIAMQKTVMARRSSTGNSQNNTSLTSCLKNILDKKDIKLENRPSADALLRRLNQQNPLNSSSSQSQQRVNTVTRGLFSSRQLIRERALLPKPKLSLSQSTTAVDYSMLVPQIRENKRKKISSTHLVTHNKRSRTSSTSSGLSSGSRCAPEAFIYPDALKDLKIWLQETLLSTKKTQAKLRKDIQGANSKQFSLTQLYQWLDTQQVELDAGCAKSNLADLLISYSQACSELVALERTQQLLTSRPGASAMDIQRSLSCAAVQYYPMATPLRYRIAAFVWRRKVALRPKQLEIAVRMLKDKGCLASLDCGGGKTAIVGPLFATLEKNLLIKAFPPGVIDQQSEVLKVSAESSKGTTVNRVVLTRENVFSKLPEFQRMMESARQQGSPLVATVSDLSALVLGYFETLVPRSPHRRYREDLETILKTFKTGSSLLLDEVDTAAKEQVHWTRGREVPLSSITADNCVTVYSLLLKRLANQDEGLVSFMGSRFSRERYDVLLKGLVTELLDQGHLSYVSQNVDKVWLKQYLLADRGNGENAALEEGLKSDALQGVGNHVQSLRALLQVYIPYALSMRYRVDYGPDESQSSVVPYIAANQADPKCRYTYRELVAILTIQWGLQETPPVDGVIELLGEALRKQSTALIRRWLGSNAKLTDARDILDKKGSWQAAVAKIQANPYFRLDFVAKKRLPKIKVHTHLMQFTVATLEHLMGRVVGMTATPFNRQGMDPRMAENFIPSKSIETTKELIKKCKISAAPEPHHMDNYLRNVAKKAGTHVLIDPSALLVEYSNAKLSSLIFEGAPKKIQYVLCWDIKKGEWRAWNRYGASERYQSSKHRSEQCFFFYDQARSRGTDMPLPDRCLAQVLVGKGCSFTDLKQAIERCRRAKEGSHQVEIKVPNSWGASPDQLIEITERNQALQLKDLLPLMARRQLFEICRNRFLEKLWKNPESLAFYLKHGGCADLILEAMDHSLPLKLASLKPTPSIAEELNAYMESLQTKYSRRLLTNADKEAMKAAVERCLKTLAQDGKVGAAPTLDLRVQAIQSVNAQQEAEAEARVQLERDRRQAPWKKLWSATEVLEQMETRGLPGSKAPNYFDFSDSGKVQFRALRISLLIGDRNFSPLIWISSRLLPVLAAQGIPKLEKLSSAKQARFRELIFQNLGMAEYILRVPNSRDTKSAQMLLLSAEEADRVAFALRRKKTCRLSLHRCDGTAIFPMGASRLHDSICIVTALINGRAGRISAQKIGNEVNRARTSQRWESYLKQRLVRRSYGDPLRFEDNPLVKAIKQSTTSSSSSNNSN